jgi:hypothetical protein
MARLSNHGKCALPIASGVMPLKVVTATLQVLGDAVDATVGGVTEAGTYVTYRFTGTTEADAPPAQCAETREGRPGRPADGTTEVAPGREAWESDQDPMARGGR